MTFRGYLSIVLVVEVAAVVATSVLAGSLAVALVALTVPLTLAAGFIIWRKNESVPYRIQKISPEEITGYKPGPEAEATPASLSRSIVERAEEIRRTLQGKPAEIQIEMCAFGYRACVDDMITLTHLANEAFPNAAFAEKVRLRRDRRRATEALAKAREALPPGALRATHQEQQ